MAGLTQEQADLLYMAIDGWVLASGWVSITRVSGFVFTVSGDKTGVIEKGSKLKIIDSTTKYFVVFSATYGAGVTTITMISNSNYALVGNPSAIYWSNNDKPFGWVDWFDYVGVPSASGSMTVTAYNVDYSKFRVVGKTLHFKHRISGITLAGTAGIQVIYPAPTIISFSGVFTSTIVDSVGSVGRGAIGTSFTHVRADNANWTLGNNRLIQGDGSYPL